MKFRNLFIVLFTFAFITAGTVSAKENPVKQMTNKANTELTLLRGLQTDNDGVKSGSAYMLGELKSDAAVIPLMAILHNDQNVRIRVAAALALVKIGDSRGLYAVKRAAEFDESEYVRTICKNFMNSLSK